MSILFITSGDDERTVFTSQEKYIYSLADAIGKRNADIAVITRGLNLSEADQLKSIDEFEFIFDGRIIKNKVYLSKAGNIKKYIFESADYSLRNSNDRNGTENLIYNITVYNYIANHFTDVKAICTFGLTTAISQIFMRYGERRVYYKKIRTVHIINGLNIDCTLKEELIKYLPEKEEINIMRLGGSFDLNRAAIICADRVVVGSVAYSCELKSEAKQARYCHTIRQFGFKLKGIEKALDKDVLKSRNKLIKYPYAPDSIEEKAKNKLYLQELLNFEVSRDVPLLVSFCKSKSDLEYSLLKATSKSILSVGTQLIICIDANETYWDLRETNENNLRIIYTSDPALKTQILCSADIYIYSPPVCPYATDVEFSCKCGTVPIVYSIGGAKDIISYYDRTDQSGNGFLFNSYNSHDMLYTVWDCLGMFRNEKHHWDRLIQNAMNCDFSIEKNAEKLLNFIL